MGAQSDLSVHAPVPCDIYVCTCVYTHEQRAHTHTHTASGPVCCSEPGLTIFTSENPPKAL